MALCGVNPRISCLGEDQNNKGNTAQSWFGTWGYCGSGFLVVVAHCNTTEMCPFRICKASRATHSQNLWNIVGKCFRPQHALRGGRWCRWIAQLYTLCLCYCLESLNVASHTRCACYFAATRLFCPRNASLLFKITISCWKKKGVDRMNCLSVLPPLLLHPVW